MSNIIPCPTDDLSLCLPKKLLQSMKVQMKEITSTKEKSAEFLQEAGILDKREKFTPPYLELGKARTAPTQD